MYRILVGLLSCHAFASACEDGEYSYLFDCYPCPKNTYDSDSFWGDCDNCPDGYYTKEEKSKTVDDCKPCPLGTHQPESKADCEHCPVYTYSDGEGQTRCHTCPVGYITYSTGSKHASDCIDPLQTTRTTKVGTTALSSPTESTTTHSVSLETSETSTTLQTNVSSPSSHSILDPVDKFPSTVVIVPVISLVVIIVAIVAGLCCLKRYRQSRNSLPKQLDNTELQATHTANNVCDFGRSQTEHRTDKPTIYSSIDNDNERNIADNIQCDETAFYCNTTTEQTIQSKARATEGQEEKCYDYWNAANITGTHHDKTGVVGENEYDHTQSVLDVSTRTPNVDHETYSHLMSNDLDQYSHLESNQNKTAFSQYTENNYSQFKPTDSTTEDNANYNYTLVQKTQN